MSRATIASKGQITIPKDIRDLLNLHSGDKVHFFVDESGAVHFLPVNRDVSTLKGIIAKPKRKVTVEREVERPGYQYTCALHRAGRPQTGGSGYRLY
jgi:antitoxin PrlF